MSFGAVCEEWRSLAAEKRAHLLPRIMAMLHDENNADKGWLTTVDKSSAEISLLNPFTKNQILLPSISLVFQDLREKNMLEYQALPLEPTSEENRVVEDITKAIVFFSSSSDSDYIVIILLWNSVSIPYYRSGDEKWSLRGACTNLTDDIVYDKEKVYVMHDWTIFKVIDLNNPDLNKDWRDFQVSDEALLYGYPDKTYLVQSLENELMKIIRYVVCDDLDLYGWNRYGTVGFEVFMLHESTKSWVKVYDLGHQVLFLGLNVICLNATSVPECIPNSIYFTDYKRTNDWCDMGVFKMEDQSIKPLCENSPFMHNTNYMVYP